MVTSRSTGDDLTDDQDKRTSDIVAAPRQQPRKPGPAQSGTAQSGTAQSSTTQPNTAQPASAKSAPARTAPPDDAVSDGTAGGGASPNGASAGGHEDAQAADAQANGAARGGTRPAVDETIVDGVPALPADTIGSSHGAKSRVDDDPARATDPVAPAPGSGALSSGALASGAAPQADSRPSPADLPLSPAAFAWEMPDPPPSSPSSPARTFLRSGTTSKDPAAPNAGPSAGPAVAAAGLGVAAAAPSLSAGPSTVGGPAQHATGQKGPAHEDTPQKAGAQKGQKARQRRTAARQAHLTIARVEPWSVMKFSFVVSLVAFVILFVAVSVLYGALAGLGVFDSLQRVVSSVTSSQGSVGVNARTWFSASRVLGYTALLGSLNIVLITAMSTIGAVVYNLTSRLVGGVEVTLRETELRPGRARPRTSAPPAGPVR